jgi:hypothetical protein
MKFRIWHKSQIPGKSFKLTVQSPEEGQEILDILADYDLFQFENNIKPDYSNASGIECFENGEWIDYYDDCAK